MLKLKEKNEENNENIEPLRMIMRRKKIILNQKRMKEIKVKKKINN